MRIPHTAMRKFKTRVVAASGLALLVLTMSLLSRGHSTAQVPRDCPGVSICNTDAQPVPVRGAVQINNQDAQAIPVRQTGVARVEGAVQINNSESQPIPVSPQGVTQIGGTVDVRTPVRVQTSPREPIHVALVVAPENFFYAQGTLGLRPGDNSVLFSPPGFEAPPGKILVLKQVSADIEMGHPVQVPHVSLKKAHPIAPATYPLLEVRQGATEWGISQSLGLWFAPGTPIEILFQRNGTAGQATLTLALTGELHDAQ